MAIAPGTRLGPYEIVAPLGAGGMGEVYRARDPRLGREVAVKVLPQHLSSSPEVRARFEREAKTISTLNHPHICVLHDIGREADTDFLVMELIEGETLAQRLTKGPLPVAEVLKLGAQIADALDRAHRAGVIHRDLKPGNVMLTRSGAKLMDFGLARATGLAGPAGGSGATVLAMTQSPTMAAPLTAEGTIVGTFQYMAPEQLEGKDADARSDLWALGCVLYEMTTGKRAFEGGSQASLIGAIMNATPASLRQLAPLSPPALERVVSALLAKDPDERWQSAGDVRRELEWIAGGASSSAAATPAIATRRAPSSLRTVAALVAGAVLASAGWLLLAPHPPRPPGAAILDLPTAPGSRLSPEEDADIAISPDGRWLAYAGLDTASVTHLWVRALDSPNARMIPETDRAQRPFWSPDGRWIGYFTTGDGASLMKVPLADGPPVKLCDVTWTRGGTWGRHGNILFSPSPVSPIMRISANGGPVTAATALDSTRRETSHRHPSFLADGDHFVFAALPVTPQGWTICLGSLRSRVIKRLGYATSAATWAAPGYLLFDRDGRCVAQRLDPERLELTGDVIPLVETHTNGPEDATRIATASSNGRIALLRSERAVRHFQWLDRSGAPGARLPIPSDVFVAPVVSHDGRYAGVSRLVSRAVAQALRIDLGRGIASALTNAQEYNYVGCWSPDDRTLAMTTARQGGHEEISLIPADGSQPPRLLPTTTTQFKTPVSWSPDGRSLVVGQIAPGTGRDLFVVDAVHGGEPRPLATDPGAQFIADISPDGAWVVYDSDETGVPQIFIRHFPDGGRKLQLTTVGGSEPHWTQGGREVVFIGNDRRSFYSVQFEPGREPGPDAARLLFRSSYPVDGSGWSVTRDGRRFLVLAPDAAAPEASTTVIDDWPALLEKR
ncbi:MAG: protein kinase [Candidatus Eisenbacteria bacterium]